MSDGDDPELSVPDRGIARGGADSSEEQSGVSDPVGVIAIILGCIGLVTFGFVLAIVTAVVASIEGRRALAERRSPENAYIAFGLAALDAVVFLVLHYMFHLPAFAG
jgi:hypothetical protein